MINVNDNNFKKEVLESEVPVLVDLWATWCRPCNMLMPILQKLSELYDSSQFKFVKLNVDENQVSKEYNVAAIPTLLFFKNGDLVERHVGLIKELDLKQKIDKYVN